MPWPAPCSGVLPTWCTIEVAALLASIEEADGSLSLGTYDDAQQAASEKKIQISNPHLINQKSVIFKVHKNTSSECLKYKCHIAPSTWPLAIHTCTQCTALVHPKVIECLFFSFWIPTSSKVDPLRCIHKNLDFSIF